MNQPKALKWRPGDIGVYNQQAETILGTYNIWRNSLWAPPGHRRGDEGIATKNAKAAARRHYVNTLARA